MNYTSRIQANVRRIITPLEDCPQNICNDTTINRIIKHKDSLGAYRDTLENITLAYTSTRIPVADSLQALNAVIRHLKTILRRAGASSTTYTPSPLSTTQSTVIQYVSEYGFSKLTDLWLRDAILYEFFMSLLRYQNEINIDVIQFSGCRQSYQCGCSVLELCRLNYQSCV
ncbi:uncharacterized protein [Antedon mediterranea]|uniref:uncharacterized protein n=1 Tax=Antedon mediterranea TaxID=105859 RepID=UPI003AF4EF0D